MKPPLKKPCKRCPFRRASIPGWLGNSTPAEFMEQTIGDIPMPCHCTVDYSQPDWRERMAETGRFCSGALIFFANLLKLSRDRDRPRLKADKATVFASVNEFLGHHHDWQNGERPKGRSDE